MNNVIFSQSAIFRLQQLASQVYRDTGVRHKLSNSQGIVSLLNASVYSTKRDIQTHYDALVVELNERQINALLNQGVNIRPPLSTTQALRQQH